MTDHVPGYLEGTRLDEGETPITPETALVVIAQELRGVRRILTAMAFDPEGDGTVLGQIHTVLHDTLQTFGPSGAGRETSRCPRRVARGRRAMHSVSIHGGRAPWRGGRGGDPGRCHSGGGVGVGEGAETDVDGAAEGLAAIDEAALTRGQVDGDFVRALGDIGRESIRSGRSRLLHKSQRARRCGS